MREVTTWDIYVAFRVAQANFHSRPYRLPKDWEKHLQTKMSEKNREALELAAQGFSTKWSNINIDKYMEVGFDVIGKGFTYVRFFDPKIMRLYIERDKHAKRDLAVSKQAIIRSSKFVKSYMRGRNHHDKVSLINQFGKLREGNESVAVRCYIQDKIDKFFLTWMIKEGYLRLEDEDRVQIPYIVEKYREYIAKLDDIKEFMEKVRSLL